MNIRGNRIQHQFQDVTKEFVEYFRKECIEEGYSAIYVCRKLKGGIQKLKRGFNEFPELKVMHEEYISRKRHKPSFGYRNI
jgi:hypothetical protein